MYFTNNEVRECYGWGHFDRINNCVLEIVGKETLLTRQIIINYAEAHKVCPHELSLDAALFCDVIICDYNYVYDPKVMLRRFFGEGARRDYLLLTDEAHNLAERAGVSRYA